MPNDIIKIKLLPKQAQFIFSKTKEIMYSGGYGSGKEQPYDSIVYVPDGKTTMGNLKVDDLVCMPDGKSSRIEEIFERGEKDIYTITFSDGTSVECGLEHLWRVYWQHEKSNRVGTHKDGRRIYKHIEETALLTTEQLLESKRYPRYFSPYMPKINGRPYIKLTQPVYFNTKPITIDPYLLGLLLGDGYINNRIVSFTTGDKQIIDCVSSIIKEKYIGCYQPHRGKYNYSICFKRPSAKGRTGLGHEHYNIIKTQLEELGLYGTKSGTKFIPKNYIYNSKEIRLNVLRGLMDTDGWHEKKPGGCCGCYFGSISKQLALDVKEIAESLGVDCCNFKEVTKRCTNSKTQATCQFFMFRLSCDKASFLFNLKRKKNRSNNYRKTERKTKRFIEKIEKTGFKQCRCIKIEDNRGLYLTNNFIITHNSRALCYKAVIHASEPGNTVILVRKTMTALKKTTLKTLLEPDGTLPPVLPRNSYHHDKMNSVITLNGGGQILYFGCDNEMSIRSMNLGGVFIDEGVELEEEEYMELLYRLRNTSASFRQICIATNPGNQNHFLFERFFKDINKDRQVITSSSLDNRFLIVDYVESLKQMTGTMFSKYVDGYWCALEHGIYPEFSREEHCRCKKTSDFNEFVLGLDFGFSVPSAFAFFGIGKESSLHLLEEYSKTKMLIGDIIKRCERYRPLNPKIVVDPSAAHLIAELEMHGFNVTGADNELYHGISRARDMLSSGRLTLDSKCVEFIKELENYSYDEKNRPVKKNDHLMDAMRYAVNYLYNEKFSSSKPVLLSYSDYEE